MENESLDTSLVDEGTTFVLVLSKYLNNPPYLKLSINRPVLLNDLVGLNFSKNSLLNDQVHLRKIDSTVLYQGCQGHFLESIKRPGLDIWKKTIKQPVLSFFQILEQPGLIIESLEYMFWVIIAKYSLL
jgi:hypothetical protein